MNRCILFGNGNLGFRNCRPRGCQKPSLAIAHIILEGCVTRASTIVCGSRLVVRPRCEQILSVFYHCSPETKYVPTAFRYRYSID